MGGLQTTGRSDAVEPDPERADRLRPRAGSNYEQAANNPDAFGAGTARGLGSVADASNVISLQAQALNNETEHQAAQNALVAKNQALQFDPKTGSQSLLGKDAIDAYPDYLKQAQQNYDDVRSGLSNQAVQRMFDANAPRTLRYTLDSMGQHADQQNKVYQIGTAQAAVNRAEQRFEPLQRRSAVFATEGGAAGGAS